MLVHYYGITNCRLEDWNGEDALIAPTFANSVQLQERGFFQTPGGEWIHILTPEEAGRVRYHETCFPNAPLIFGNDPNVIEETREAEQLCKITNALLFIAPVTPFFGLIMINFLMAEVTLSFLAELCLVLACPALLLIAAFVAAIFNRVQHPHSDKASRMLRKMVVGMIVGVFGALITIAACNCACEGAKRDWNKYFERYGCQIK